MESAGDGKHARPNLYVIARFLDALARPDRTLTRNQLQAAVGVNYDILRRYLRFLEARGCVTVSQSGGSEVILLTAEGRKVREELGRWIARFVGESIL